MQTTRDHTDLLLFGDSLTEWGPWSTLLPGKRLNNLGIAGDTTSGMLSRVHDSLSPKPRQVLVMAGINDLLLERATVVETATRYLQLLDYWRGHALPVLVQSTLHVGAALAPLNPLVTELNQRLQQYCAKHTELTFIDLNAALCPTGVLTPEHTQDGVHLTPLAYRQWGRVLEAYLL